MMHSKLVYILLFTIVFSSCTQIFYTNIDVLHPAEVTFSPAKNRLLIIDNTIMQPLDYGHKVQLYDSKAVYVKVKTDSLSFFCLEALANELAEKDFFKYITLHNVRINESSDFFELNAVQQDSIDSLCNRYGSDVVLSLERIKVLDNMDEYFVNDNGNFLMNLEARFESRWHVYYAKKDGVEQNVIFRDTLSWSAEADSKGKAYYKMPVYEDALIDGAAYAGRNAVNRLIPRWEKSERFFFNPKNKNFVAAFNAVQSRKWEIAVLQYSKTMERIKQWNLKAYTAHNIALCYEIMGNIDKAIEYSNSAVAYIKKYSLADLNYVLTIENYNRELMLRKVEFQLLDKQLGD